MTFLRRALDKRWHKTVMLILCNVLVVVLLFVLFDVAATKFDLLPLRVAMNGRAVLGFSPKPILLGSRSGDPSDDVLTVAVLGDSNHVWKDAPVHQSTVLSSRLGAEGISHRMISLGKGGWSPLQEWVAYQEIIAPRYDVDVAIILLYAGNDFAEILRNDDRPRLEHNALNEPYIAKPKWAGRRVEGSEVTLWPRDSRLLYQLNVTSQHNLGLKVIAGYRAMDMFDAGFIDRMAYLGNLWRFKDNRLGYSGAVAAMFLNQAYLYTRYKEIFRREVSWRLEYVFRVFHERHPSTGLLVFFLPSAPAVSALTPANEQILEDIKSRTGLENLDFSAIERELYGLTEQAVMASGELVFLIDLAPALLRAMANDEAATFYDEPTMHIDVKARNVVGREMARVLLSCLKRDKTSTIFDPMCLRDPVVRLSQRDGLPAARDPVTPD